jgi:hypothetical protein
MGMTWYSERTQLGISFSLDVMQSAPLLNNQPLQEGEGNTADDSLYMPPFCCDNTVKVKHEHWQARQPFLKVTKRF